MNILIVDDSNDKIAKIVSVIKDVSENFNIDTVIDSVSAQRKLQQVKYDLLLLDLLLPLRRGYEPVPDGGKKLLKEIYRNQKIKVPTIIAGITQHEECKGYFSPIWKLLFFNNVEWTDDLKEIILHIERSNKHQSDALTIKRPTIIVEGETDSIIIYESLKIFAPDFTKKIDVKFQKNGGANWVSNQIVVWAFSHSKNKDGTLVKCIGLLDGDQAGIDANTEINRVVKSDSAGANSFKIIKLSPDYAQDTVPLYKKGLALPVTLEELYPPEFWQLSENRGWVECRTNLDLLLKEPKNWNKMNQSLNDYISTLELQPPEEIYLKKYKRSSKEKVVKYIENLETAEKRTLLRNFEKLVDDMINYLFK
jgi:CheY-like chemotaxis protein